MLFKIGDLVTRNSYNNDTLFKITSINSGIVYLKGVDVRLYADSPPEDLRIENKEIKTGERDKVFIDEMDDIINLDRSEYFYLPGKILHIEADFFVTDTLANPYRIRENG